MIEFYAEIRLVHVYFVIASGSLFLLRGLVLFAGGQWAMAPALWYRSYTPPGASVFPKEKVANETGLAAQ